MTARIRRLMSDWEQVKKDFSSHKYILVEPIEGEPPEKYKVTYFVNGIYLLEDDRIATLGRHVVEISLHADYPRYKPICTILTPIWHPNFRDHQICIGDIWGAGESLSDIIVNIGDMIQYKSWNAFSPLSADAAAWAIENRYIFPVGTVDLWKGEEVEWSREDEFDIDILGEGTEESDHQAPYEMEVDQNTLTDLTEEINQVEYSTELALVPNLESLEDENDFEISTEELQGIEYVPSAQRMQNVKHTAGVKGSRVNFKTVFMKGILYGLIGAVIAWIINEALDIDNRTIIGWFGYSLPELLKDAKNNGIPSAQTIHLIYIATLINTVIFSGIIGGGIGAVMGLGEGLYYGSKRKAAQYALIGFGIALLISGIGGLLAQILYSNLLKNANEYTSIFYNAFVRAIGWSVMGVGVGFAIGLIKPERIRIINCIIGGLAGGFLGGFIFDFVWLMVRVGEQDTGIIPRGIGIITMGILIGLGIGLLEQFAKTAWLKVIRGEFEGKEYLVFSELTSIGNNGRNSIVLFKDKLVAPQHCDILLEGNKYVLVDKGSPMGTIVNGMLVNRHILRQGDAIAIGNSVLIFNTK